MENTIETNEDLDVQGFDAAAQPLDLTKDEKRRTTALMLAIQAWSKTIIPDGNYLKEAADLARRGDGPKLHAADVSGICITAAQFDHFIETGRVLRPALEAPKGETDDTLRDE